MQSGCVRGFVFLCLPAIALALSFCRAGAEETPPPAPIFPKALAAGDTIMFVAPAKYLDRQRNALAKRRLEQMGFHVRLPENLYRKQGFLAGSDDERARELMAAFADPEVDAIFPGTGGHGPPRALDKPDHDLIRPT